MYSAQPNSVDSATINPAALASPGKFWPPPLRNVIHEPSRPLRCAGSASGPGRAALLLRCPILHPLPHLHHLLLSPPLHHHHNLHHHHLHDAPPNSAPHCIHAAHRTRVKPSSRLALPQETRSHSHSPSSRRKHHGQHFWGRLANHDLMLMRCLAQIHLSTAREVSRESGRQTPIKRRRLGMTVCCDSIFV